MQQHITLTGSRYTQRTKVVTRQALWRMPDNGPLHSVMGVCRPVRVWAPGGSVPATCTTVLTSATAQLLRNPMNRRKAPHGPQQWTPFTPPPPSSAGQGSRKDERHNAPSPPRLVQPPITRQCRTFAANECGLGAVVQSRYAGSPRKSEEIEPQNTFNKLRGTTAGNQRSQTVPSPPLLAREQPQSPKI